MSRFMPHAMACVCVALCPAYVLRANFCKSPFPRISSDLREGCRVGYLSPTVRILFVSPHIFRLARIWLNEIGLRVGLDCSRGLLH